MGFEPKTLRDLARRSNHRATGDSQVNKDEIWNYLRQLECIKLLWDVGPYKDKNNSYLPINVFPVPGGPNNKIPLGGPRKPLKMSLSEERNYTPSLNCKMRRNCWSTMSLCHRRYVKSNTWNGRWMACVHGVLSVQDNSGAIKDV